MLNRKQIDRLKEWLEEGENYLEDADSELNHIATLADDLEKHIEAVGGALEEMQNELDDIKQAPDTSSDYIDSAKDKFYEITKQLREWELQAIEAEKRNINAYGGGGIVK